VQIADINSLLNRSCSVDVGKPRSGLDFRDRFLPPCCAGMMQAVWLCQMTISGIDSHCPFVFSLAHFLMTIGF